jgi:uncharacterized membrane protein YfcA
VHVSPQSFALLAAIVAIAAFVQGTTGVGFALIVAPVMAMVVPALVLGAGRYVHHRVDGRALRAFVLLFAIASGVVLVLRS